MEHGENIRAEIERLGREWGTWYVLVYQGGSAEPWRAARIDDRTAEALTAETPGKLEEAMGADHAARSAA
jgi:hypothetical protein